jgi:fructosamine-3-kinase
VTGGEARELAESMRAALGPVADAPEAAVAGGCIAESYRWRVGAGTRAFVKTMPPGAADVLDGEAAGLAELDAAGAIRVPRVLGRGVAASHAWLALEWLELTTPSPASDARLGERLAELHRVRSDRHGWHRANHLGRTPQVNDPHGDWVTFLRTRRLAPQLERARAGGHPARLVDRGLLLLDLLGVFYASYAPAPSLLHGDLWSGNYGALAGGEPVVYDPAPYYGDREADVAMTRLFGGFGPRFHAAYQATWPLDAAAGYRRDLHNLYHVLNHLNLFGGAYAAQAERMIDGLLSEAGH